MTLRLTLVLSAVFLFVAFAIGALFTTQACFMAGAGTSYPSLQQAIHRAEPGCTVILLGGTYEENVVIDKPLRIIPRAHAKPFAVLGQHPAGTSASAAFLDPAAPSTLRAADPDRPVIEIRSSHVEIHGIRITGGRVGIQAVGVREVRLIDNVVDRAGNVGVRLDDVRGSVLQGNEISRASIGLEVLNAHEVVVADNDLRRNGQGIHLQDSTSNTLQGNRIAASESVGLRLASSDQNAIRQNAIETNATGLVMEDASNNALSGNRIDRNDVSLRVRGTNVSHFVHQIARDNTINDRPVYYLVDAEGATIDAEARPGYLALIRSRNVTVQGAALPEGSQGVLMVATQQSTLRDVTIPASERGLYLVDSRENRLIDNRIERAEGNGVSLVRSIANRLEGNVVRANDGHGVWLDGSDANELVANEIRDNAESGVHLTASRGGRLERNRIVGNWVGVYLDGGGEHRLDGNAIAKSQFGVYVQGTESNRFHRNQLTDNRHVSNRPALLEPGTEADSAEDGSTSAAHD